MSDWTLPSVVITGSTAVKVVLIAGVVLLTGRQWRLRRTQRELTARITSDSEKLRDMLSRLQEKEDEVDKLRKMLLEKEAALRERPSADLIIEELGRRDHHICENWSTSCELRGEMRALREQVRDWFVEKEAIATRVRHLESEKQKAETELSELREKIRDLEDSLEERAAENKSFKRRVRRRDQHIGHYVSMIRSIQREFREFQQQMPDILREQESLQIEIDELKRQKRTEEEEEARQKMILELMQEVLKGGNVENVKSKKDDDPQESQREGQAS